MKDENNEPDLPVPESQELLAALCADHPVHLSFQVKNPRAYAAIVAAAEAWPPVPATYKHEEGPTVYAVDTVTFTVEGRDPVSKKWYTLLASAAISAQSTVSLTVYPGVTVAANAAASRPLPRAWRVKVTHSAGTSFTYSVGASLIR